MSRLYRLAALAPSLVIARRNVSRAKVRSALAAASILIGVVAIGAIGAGGAAFKASQLDDIQDQGATDVFVSPGTDMEPRSFDREDLIAIRETVGPAGVVATRSRSMEYVRRPGRRTSVSVTYVEDPRLLYEVDQGSIPRNWRRSAVISADFAEDQAVAPGDRIWLVHDGGDGEVDRAYRVAAVLAPTSSFGTDEVFLPMETAGSERYEQVRVRTESVDRAGAAAERLRERFNGRTDRLLVFELTSLVRLFRRIVNGVNAFLAGLAAVSMLVAGVSITNTMLMATIERREEIGVLRSVGYTRRDIVRILLVEAGLLGTLGAVVGVALATGLAMLANATFLGDPLAFRGEALSYLLGALAFGVGTSLLAGAYPAWRAAGERPVNALRG